MNVFVVVIKEEGEWRVTQWAAPWGDDEHAQGFVRMTSREEAESGRDKAALHYPREQYAIAAVAVIP